MNMKTIIIKCIQDDPLYKGWHAYYEGQKIPSGHGETPERALKALQQDKKRIKTSYNSWLKNALIDAQKKLPDWEIKAIAEDGTVYYGNSFMHTSPAFVNPYVS